MKRKWLWNVMGVALAGLLLVGCGGTDVSKEAKNTLVYGSHDYTRINPAIDEHGEINALIFNGLTAHNAAGDVVPSLAKSWDIDEATNTYTFHLHEGVKWHDGKPFTANDVKFTIDAIKDPNNESEIASNYEEVQSIEVVDPLTVKFVLSEKNVAFLEYMTIGILPEHLLKGQDMQTAEYFKNPVGTGPYKLVKWNVGQSIDLAKNDEYFEGPAKIENIIFKIVEDDNAKALQLKSGELNLAQVTPKAAMSFTDDKAYNVYTMTTSDYRGIMYNFNNPFWKANADIIPAINYAIDRPAIVKAVMLDQGIVAYGPLQRNKFNNPNVEQYKYNPEKSEEILQAHGWHKNAQGIYEKNGQELTFTINCKEGDQVRLDIAMLAVQQLNKVGINAKAEVKAKIDWENQEAFLIGWGSPFDADDHTYKVFATGKGNNYNYYSNADVDKFLKIARQTNNEAERAAAYNSFQEALANNPAYTFICYCDVDYVADKDIKGIDKDVVLGHHGVGIFWNVKDWTI